MFFLVFTLILAALAALYYLLTKPYQYWPAKGVKQTKPKIFFGDNFGMIFGTESAADMVKRIYNACPGTRYSGTYQFSTPTLVLRDPDLIKQITVKDFDHFTDHQSFFPMDNPVWEKNLFILTGKKWRDMRATLSPSFTTSKMRFMFVLMSESAKNFTNFFAKQDEDLIEIDMKDTFRRFTNDVIASAAFGIQVDSLVEKNNDFYVMGEELINTSGFSKNMKIFLYLLLPKIYKFFGLQFTPNKIISFFIDLVRKSIKTREKNNIVRPDMIHLLMEARKCNDKIEETADVIDAGFATVQESNIGKVKVKTQLDDLDIAAQAMIFFTAGFDSVSSLMCFMSHELAVNFDIQNRLRDEINETFKECGGTLTYEALLKMKYLDMVVSETLRKWTNGFATNRICTKPYTIEPINKNERSLHLEVGDLICLPTLGLHYDPEYFPDPERFDPERFSEGNKGNINPYTYIPFGVGPRNCIASRFALLETKALFFYILRTFEIVPVEKSVIPIKLSKIFALTVEGGFWFGFKRIGNKN